MHLTKKSEQKNLMQSDNTQPKVLNLKHLNGVIPDNAIYVGRGRGSKWGNPYKINKRTNRELAISLYQNYIDDKIASNQIDIIELRGKDLVCWCAPLPCHADYLLQLANIK